MSSPNELEKLKSTTDGGSNWVSCHAMELSLLPSLLLPPVNAWPP